MVSVLVKNDVEWWAPSPLWPTRDGAGGNDDGSVLSPAILRFANDEFMEELLRVLAYFPDQLDQWVAQKETWRLPMPSPTAAASLDVTRPISKLSQRNQRLKQKRAQLQGAAQLGSASTETDDNTSEAQNGRERLEFKLYQTGQQRYYLVSASLVCARPGRPDRKVDPGKQERTSFVVRRRIRPDGGGDDPSSWLEHAYVLTPNGPAWRQVTEYNMSKEERVMPGEERLPLFELAFTDRRGSPRKIHAGLIPVGRREEYMGASLYQESTDQGGQDQEAGSGAVNQDKQILMDLFESDVAARWRIVVEQIAAEEKALTQWSGTFPLEGFEDNDKRFVAPTDGGLNNDLRKRSREQIQTASWYILLDFAKFLEQYLPDVWHLMTGSTEAVGDALDRAEAFEQALSDISIQSEQLRSIDDVFFQSDIKATLTDALVAIRGGAPYNLEKAQEIEDDLDEVDVPYDREKIDEKWPSFLFPLADPQVLFPLSNLDIHPDIDITDYIEEDPSDQDEQAKAEALARIDSLARLVADALPAEPQAPVPEPLVLTQPIKDPGEARFVIRCVYERPNCDPLATEVVSEPSRHFEMASFFDPDAPGRPIRIPMPLDFSPAGLRKFKKNAGFVLSDMLCAQLKRTRKLTLGDLVLSVLPWPFHKDLPKPGPLKSCGPPGATFGLICSLSIPIVTLCAMILLIIMVVLFDTFFRWLPYLFVCLPIPGLKGKKG